MSDNNPLVHLVTDDEVKEQARQLFEGMKQKMGKVPKWMRVMANNEDVLIGFFTMFKAIMDDAPLPAVLKWKAALKVSDANKCEYCVSVAKFQLKAFGLTEQQMTNIDSELNDKEKLAIDFALEVNEHAYQIDPDVLNKTRETFSDAELVELVSVVGLFNHINRFNDALNILPDVQ